jgi:hypothetical protein
VTSLSQGNNIVFICSSSLIKNRLSSAPLLSGKYYCHYYGIPSEKYILSTVLYYYDHLSPLLSREHHYLFYRTIKKYNYYTFRLLSLEENTVAFLLGTFEGCLVANNAFSRIRGDETQAFGCPREKGSLHCTEFKAPKKLHEWNARFGRF